MTLITQQHNLAVKKNRHESKHKKACREKRGFPSMESALGDSSSLQEGYGRAYKCGVCQQYHLAKANRGSTLRDLFTQIEQERNEKPMQ